MPQNRKVSLSLPPDLLAYADTYRQAHGLSSRNEVFVLALQVLRNAELAEGYRAMAADYAIHPDLLAEGGVEGLEPSDETTW